MNYSPYIYHEGPQAYVFPQESSNYYQLQLPDDDGNPGDLAMFDPMIQSHSPPPTQQQSPWTPPQQLQRFMGEKQKTLFNASPSLQPFQNPSLMQGVAPLPPASHRQASPLPLTASSSSTCSIALSPAGESDVYHENTPSTPPDYALTSPSSYHTSSSPSDMWPPQSQQQQLYFSGMARGSPIDTCVNPLDVNSTQDTHFDTFEADNVVLDFSPLQRGYSLQSHSSNSFEVEQPVQLPRELLKQHNYHVDVPQQETQDEICIPDTQTLAYPVTTPLSQDQTEDLDDADADDNSDNDQIDDTTEDHTLAASTPDVYFKVEDQDSDYEPNPRRRAPPKTTKPTRSSTKRAAPTSPSTRQSPKRIKSNASATTGVQSSKQMPPTKMVGPFTCSQCPRTPSFKNEAGLAEHMRKTHTRPFTCVFAFAGCTSKFAAKNEWKRHVNSQHLLLTYWLCGLENCAKAAAATSSAPSSSLTSSGKTSASNSTGFAIAAGAVFNRKDLYTQHIRRMHTPPQIKKLTKEAKKAAAVASASGATTRDAEQIAQWEERLRVLQGDAEKTRCELPTFMRCPAVGCGMEFRGAEAWDQRMEHVAKHLELAGAGGEEGVSGAEGISGGIEFGGAGDPTLMEWAARSDVAVVKWVGGKWVLNNPLKDGPLGDVEMGVLGQAHDYAEDGEGEIVVGEEYEDAEGEDE